MSESSCEKSCQVTSEQIKADMKAAAENSRRTSSKGISTETGETTTRPGVDSGLVQAAGTAGAAAGTGSVDRTGPGSAMSRQVGGCGRMMAGITHRAASQTDRATGQSWTNDSAEGSSGPLTGDRKTRVVQGSGPEPRAAAVNHAPRGQALLAEQGQRQPVAAGSAFALDSAPRQGRPRAEDFIPRRPLTRSCSRMTSMPLVPETGTTSATNRSFY